VDEIGDISAATQVKLLRVLQEKEFERVGGQTPIHSDIRVITATSRNLEEMIEKETFRADLYYRLNVFPIYVPPLRDRKSDLLLLVDHFTEKYAKLNQKTVRRISTAAIDLLVSYHWPGNVRELENCMEREVLLCQGQAIEAQHLPPTLQKKDPSEKSPKGASASRSSELTTSAFGAGRTRASAAPMSSSSSNPGQQAGKQEHVDEMKQHEAGRMGHARHPVRRPGNHDDMAEEPP
jgi:transcriptional regulator with PAS, ATPase and Fis domain